MRNVCEGTGPYLTVEVKSIYICTELHKTTYTYAHADTQACALVKSEKGQWTAPMSIS